MRRVRVGDVLQLQRRAVVIDPAAEYRLVGVYSFGKGIFHREPQPGADLGNYRFFSIEPGDLVVSNIQAWEGAIGFATDVDAGTIGTHRFLSYTPIRDDEIDANWARYFFLSDAGFPLIQQAAPGSVTRNRTLSVERFEALEIPLPDIDEQRRIAAHLDRVVKLRSSMQESSGQRAERVAALAASIPEQLLTTQAERRPLHHVADIRGGLQRSASRTVSPDAKPVRYLTVAHLGTTGIRFDDPRYFQLDDAELERRQLRKGDVLIIEGNGSGAHIGRAGLFPGATEPFAHQNHLIRVRVDGDALRPAYLVQYLNSPSGRRSVLAHARTSSGLLGLSIGRIRDIEVPVPPLEQQDAVLAGLGALTDRSSTLRRAQDRSISLQDALIPSALNRAFARLA